MFQSARLKLTLYYLLILSVICGLFTVGIYRISTMEIDRFARDQKLRIERLMEQGEVQVAPRIGIRAVPAKPVIIVDPALIDQTKRRILFSLLLVDGAILFLAAGLSYLLAGRTLKPIKHMMDEQSRFISDASHELKTPLTSLKTSFEVHLRNKKRTLKEADTVIKESIEEVNKLQHLSESLLHLAKYQSQSNGLQLEKISMSQIVAAAIHKIKPLSDKKGIAIQTEVDKVSIDGLKYELTDLLVILLDNAVKYSSAGSIVSVTVEKMDGKVKIEVADEGAGINERDLPFIFDRFYRADQSRTKLQADGYGLGLAIAKRIVELHRGWINVQSQVGQGTTFTITLPIKATRPRTAAFR